MGARLRAYGRELLRPTLEIAERCNVEIELGTHPAAALRRAGGEDAFAYLRGSARRGWPSATATVTPELRDRLEFELQTIREMGFADYFLIVWDFVRFAKANGIGVGPGRGSAAGSLVAYALRITDVDPIRYDLLFERFLNPGRKSMPDIDIDFSVHGRERVMEYVVEKYGRERVAQIITFGKLAAKAAVRDTGRVLGLPFGVVDRIAKMIPEGVKVGFDDCLKPGQDLRDRPTTRTSSRRARIVDMARPLEGLVRADSIHAAAVVIGDRALAEYLPLQRKGADEPSSSRSTRWATSRRSACSRWTSSACATSTSSTRPCGSSRESRGHRARHWALPLDDQRRTRCSRGATRPACSSSSRAACATRCAR